MLHFRLTILSLFALVIASGQSPDFDKYRLDTFHLSPINISKVVAYKSNGITFYVDRDRYREAIYPYWKNHHLSKKELERKSKSDKYVNPDWDNRRIALDSVYSLLTDKSKPGDTLLLFHFMADIDKVGFVTKFFAEEIENNRCIIQDINGSLQTVIIRQKGSYYGGPLNAWGGRRFYLPGHTKYFLEVEDWYS